MKINKLDFLISFYIFAIVVAELMGGKTFPIGKIGGFALNASVAIFLIPLVYSINDIIVEVHGKEKARGVIRSGITMVFFLILVTAFFTVLPPSTRFVPSEPAYDLIFKQSLRISAASLLAFAIADMLDLLIFVRLREALGKKVLWFRNNLSNIISLFFDTAIFITLAFYALDRPFNDNLVFLAGIIIPYWLLKCFMSAIVTPFVYLGVKWLRKEE
ncbi:hypothetical protein A2970_01910 [Candidatus Roizmanbacteria bacterium RIFCSPLOWO2_01_FULL_44_13]|uniref:Probable queuosine precursor transporter n=1 Tax=Candidatus Roizmanbacteria bacterium RIFCSPLOWO2_01_FULL_44_13 TaxID=1802069 RepID=A0A1F7JBE8_9BACT|nr:MAG: hypothetical protein A2970_01910 [Candidatus Roizmanbacteria bacterium RIFCSPLOWO2_01_FULL_44_13]